MNRRSTILLILAVTSVLAAGWWAFHPAVPVDPEQTETTTSRAPPRAELARNDKSRRPTHERSSFPLEKQPPAPSAERRPDRVPDAGGQAADTHAAVTQSADAGADEPTWEDPTNSKVLGRKSWMAPVDEAEEARIDQVFENARAARYDPRLPDRSRATSIVTAKEVVDRCFDALTARQPGIQGRLIVAWTAGATDGLGQITNPRIKVNYKLDEPQFEACVLDGLSGRTFRGADGDAIEVEAPFFYDGSF